ncbi:general odorant-binding protein 28a-like [Drosophila subpulchrella]|uniref:general odorant-binding protein 28a-like n=1 Tax=Drosophila subpulchrella TaxID=1486046 RepID=UPI0018A16313|nr:general odorant-binding protein 28a-like [Drosophila subpulchrella]
MFLFYSCGNYSLGTTLVLDEKENPMTEVNAADADMQKLIKKQPTATYAGNCLRAGVMKSFGLLGANGNLDAEAGLEKAKQYTGNDPVKFKLALEIGDTCVGSYGACSTGEVKRGPI